MQKCKICGEAVQTRYKNADIYHHACMMKTTEIIRNKVQRHMKGKSDGRKS